MSVKQHQQATSGHDGRLQGSLKASRQHGGQYDGQRSSQPHGGPLHAEDPPSVRPPAPGYSAADIIAAHDAYLDGAPLAPRELAGWHWIEENHRCNAALWREEDKARRTDVPDAEIVRCKRSIDRFNQQRNDAVEALDECVLGALAGTVKPQPDAQQSSETVGAIIDRLSILSLKIFNMGLQTRRADASKEHVASCCAKLDVLVRQRRDLAACLDRLLEGLASGRVIFRTYRQYKMYNDPALNPELYGRKDAPVGASARDGERTSASMPSSRPATVVPHGLSR
ncbi:MAG: DUF4254 domain-containing protein [Methyloversatilis sp.]|nr:DUF4254 domain-containing protein [Methyloversatilis sp.]